MTCVAHILCSFINHLSIPYCSVLVYFLVHSPEAPRAQLVSFIIPKIAQEIKLFYCLIQIVNFNLFIYLSSQALLTLKFLISEDFFLQCHDVKNGLFFISQKKKKKKKNGLFRRICLSIIFTLLIYMKNEINRSTNK